LKFIKLNILWNLARVSDCFLGLQVARSEHERVGARMVCAKPNKDRLKPVDEDPLLNRQTYYTRGETALLDAIGASAIEKVREIEVLPMDERPEKVIVVILMEGLENTSREFTRATVLELIRQRQDQGGSSRFWTRTSICRQGRWQLRDTGNGCVFEV
jgi:hypothetical protein